MQNILNWFRRQLSNPQVIILALILIVFFVLIAIAGSLIAPVIAALVIAYVLEGGVQTFQRLKFPRALATSVVILLFLILLIALLFGLLPIVSAQAVQLASQIPSWISEGQAALLRLPEVYPELVSEDQVRQIIGGIAGEVSGLGQKLIGWSASSVVGVITIIVYLILVPILAFFFLKDKDMLTQWSAKYLPTRDHGLVQQVWEDVDRQMSNYIRGKVWEILIVGTVTLVTFSVCGLQFALLLSAVVAISVLVPFVGAALVTIPVVLVALFQWGISPQFTYLVLAYFIIQVLDGYVLVPLIFSEVVDLHPIALVVAILIFGGIWGIWGVFFAIPLATLVQAVLTSWPKSHEIEIS